MLQAEHNGAEAETSLNAGVDLLGVLLTNAKITVCPCASCRIHFAQISLAARWWSHLLNDEYVWRGRACIATHARLLVARYPALVDATLYAGNTPLMLAIEGGWAYVRELRENDEERADEERTHLGVARVLIAEATTRVNRRNTRGRTALDIAQYHGTVRHLLQREDLDVQTRYATNARWPAVYPNFYISYDGM